MAQHTRSGRLVAYGTAIVGAGALLLTGCSGSGGAEPSASGAPESTSFSLMYAVSNDFDNPFEVAAESYMKEHPEVTITLNGVPGDSYNQTLTTQLQAGNASDVFQSASGSGEGRSVLPLAEAGLLAPLSDMSASIIPAGSEELLTYDGEVYGQPVDAQFVGTNVNVKALEDGGVKEYPTSEKELLAACKKLADNGQSMFVVAGSAANNLTFMTLGIAATRVYQQDPDWNQKRLDGDVTFADSEEWQDTLEMVLTLKDNGCFQPGVEAGAIANITNALTQGTSASAFVPGASATTLNDATGTEDFLVQTFPAESASDPAFAYVSATYALSITEASANKEAAQAFLDWLAEPENSREFSDTAGTLPVTGWDDLDLSDTTYSAVVDVLKDGNYAPYPAAFWPNPEVTSELGKGVQGLLTGQATVDQVLTSLDAAWDK